MISVGIDISKGKSTVCILKPFGEVLKSPFEIEHNTKSMNEFVSTLISYEEEVRVVMEATGAYHLPVLDVLKHHNIFVSLINPLVMKKYVSTAIRKGKTDKLDSIRIANYGIDNWFKLVDHKKDPNIYLELRLLGRQYSRYIEMKVTNRQILGNILDRIMPGILQLIPAKNSRKPTKDKLCDFVEEFEHFDNIKSMDEQEFIERYRSWIKRNGYRHSEKKASTIYHLACNSIITLPSNSPITKMLTMDTVRVLREINKTLESILSQMQNIVTALPEYDIVISMNGVGDILAPRLIGEIGDIKRFHNGSSLVAYAGIDAPPYESGSYTSSNRHISKRGSALLRKIGYEIVTCIKSIKPTEDNAVYLFMLKKAAEGKPNKVVKIAALNKFLRIYYARIRDCYLN